MLRFKVVELFSKPTQTLGRFVRCKKFDGLRLKYDYRGWEFSLLRCILELFQHVLMTQVNAIEITDGYCAGR